LLEGHTLQHFRQLWQPTLFDRRRAEDWAAAGAQRLGQRLRDKTIAIIDSHEPEPLPDGVREEISYILGSGT
jgi:trimethylamine--corrinoid protein Co-methyltransferase